MNIITFKPSASLNRLATNYVWWNTLDWAYKHPEVFLANVMNLGNWDDLQVLQQEINREVLQKILQNAPAGYFHQRSWDYWHAKFGIKPIPPLPTRKL